MISATKTRKLVNMAKIEEDFPVKKAFLSLLVLFFVLKNVSADQVSSDFYGVKMMSEYHAKDLVVDESGPTPAFSADKPGMDKRIYATAVLSGRKLLIQVFNRSDETIQSDYDTAEYTVVTHDGERHVLKPAPMGWTSTNTIAPGKSATFDPSFEGRAPRKDEIRAVVCSFDLGNMKIILLPLSKTFTAKAPVAPIKPAEPSKKIELAKTKPAPKKEIQAAPKPKPVEVKKEAPKKTEEKKPLEVKKPIENKIEAKPAAYAKRPEPALALPVPTSVSAPAKGGSASDGKKIQTFSEAEKKLLDQYERSRRSRKYWHIEEVRNGVLVINLGTDDGLKPGASVQIARDGVFLAQATVRSLSQGYATATVPQEASASIKAGDDVLFFDVAV